MRLFAIFCLPLEPMGRGYLWPTRREPAKYPIGKPAALERRFGAIPACAPIVVSRRRRIWPGPLPYRATRPVEEAPPLAAGADSPERFASRPTQTAQRSRPAARCRFAARRFSTQFFVPLKLRAGAPAAARTTVRRKRARRRARASARPLAAARWRSKAPPYSPRLTGVPQMPQRRFPTSALRLV